MVVAAGLALADERAQTHEDRGLELARAGDLKGAEVELRLAVSLSPNDAEYLAGLGGILGMEQKLEEASQCFEKALKIDPSNLTVRRNLATSQWQMGRLRESVANLERILKIKPHDAPSVLLLGMVAENLKNYAQAAELLSSVPELVDGHAEALAALARSDYRIGRNEQARQILESLLKQNADPQHCFLGGQIASEAGDAETALRLFESIRSTYPDTSRLAYEIALAQYNSGHFIEAERALVDFINAGGADSESYNLLGWAYYKQDKFQDAVKAIKKAIDLDGTKESNYSDLGRMYVDHQHLNEAHEVAQRAVERNPSSFGCYMLKGMIEAKQGAFHDAVATYGRAVTFGPDSTEANYNLARMLWLSGKEDEAVATFERGIKRFPHDAPTFVEYAQMLLQRADSGDANAEARAVRLLKQACALDKTYAEPHYHLGNLWLRRGEITAALEQLQLAAQLNPGEAKTHFALSRTYRRLGRKDEEARELAEYDKLKAQGKKPD